MANPKNIKGKNSNVKRKLKASVEANALAHVKTTFNNIIMSITNKKGEVIAWSSGGKMGFKGAKKNTPHAAKLVGEDCCRIAHTEGVRGVNVFVNGPGAGREAAIRAIDAFGISVDSITDNTRIPYNGCRPPKRRRP